MPIPDFQSLMLPIMKVAEDGVDPTSRKSTAIILTTLEAVAPAFTRA